MTSAKGLFIRTLPVQLVDLSLSGCLLRGRDHLPPGAMGELHVTVNGETYRDTVYLARICERQGASGDRDLGAEFVWGQYPEEMADRALRERSTRSIVPHV